MIKSTIVLIFVFFFISPLIAQEVLNSGNRMVGGGIGVNFFNQTFNEDAENKRKINSFFFSPYLGILFQDRLMGGANLNLGASTEETSEIYDSHTYLSERTSNSIGIGIFLRKYFPLNEKLGAFLQPGLNYRFTNSDYTNNRSDFTEEYIEKEKRNINTVFVDMNLGFYYFLSNRFSIETTLGNLTLERSSSNIERENIFNEDVNKFKMKSTGFGINFINQLSFDKLFVINYFF